MAHIPFVPPVPSVRQAPAHSLTEHAGPSRPASPARPDVEVLDHDEVRQEHGKETDTAIGDDTDEVRYLCKACGLPVALSKHRTARGGAFGHTFCNPAGLIFEVGCFSHAPGCTTVGQPSGEFAWFSGYTWQVALCRGCLTHLGWRFGSPGDSFHGLILPALREQGS